MHVPRRTAALTGLAVALALVAGGATTATAATPAASPSASDRTSSEEAARVDQVDAQVDWFDCTNAIAPQFDCGTIDLPLDYDEPEGATTTVAVVRHRVADPSRKVGSIFVNPGGPGGSGADLAMSAEYLFPADVLKRFDIVGFDPRGIGYSDNVRCWRNIGEQTNDLLPTFETPYPQTAVQKADFIRSAKLFGQACSSTGQPLSSSMSTADVARDMDVLRRAVGDTKLTYLGFSYGTYLGNVYANMFPDRVRAIVLDGVLDPVAWQGSTATAGIPQTQRIASGDGAWKALQQVLAACGKKGPKYCYTARLGDPKTVFTKLTNKVKKNPIVLGDGDEVWATIDYPTIMSYLLSDLYSDYGWMLVDSDVEMFWILANESSTASKNVTRTAAEKRFAKRLAESQQLADASDDRATQIARKVPGFAFPYNSGPDGFQSVLCSDSVNPRFASTWPSAATKAEKTGSGFGALWTWASAPCASSTWTARAEDSYRGTFDHATSAPVLVVGNTWDPATNYQGAVKAAELLPNSRLVSSRSWGHTAYLTSACVTNAVTTYLVTGKAPSGNISCVGDSQPFTQKIDDGEDSFKRASTAPDRPQITPPTPGGVPTL